MDAAFQSAKYINLVTFRKDGREVATPVWFVALDQKLFAYSLQEAGKLKRIRATKRIKVAPCDMRGHVMGNWSDGTGRIVEDSGVRELAYAAFPLKYGIMYRLASLLSWLSGKYSRRVMMELTV